MKIPAFAFFTIGLISSGLSAASQPAALSVRPVSEQADGLESKYLEITGSDIEVRRFTGGNWYLLEQTAEDASVSFAHRFIPGALMDLSVYASNQLIESFDDQAIKDYITQLGQSLMGSGLLLASPQASKAPVGAVPFMGSTYWKISYTLVNSSTKQAEFARVEYVTRTEDGKNYRLRFTAAPDVSAQYEAAYERELSLFMAN